jgi:hypothetical protein
MVVAVIILSVAVCVLVIVLIREGTTAHRTIAEAPDAPKSGVEVEAARDRLEIVEGGDVVELRLDGSRLMTLEAMPVDVAGALVPLNGAYAEMLGSLLSNNRLLEFVAGQRWVLARVPDALRQGGAWMTTAEGATKAIAIGAGSSQIAAIAISSAAELPSVARSSWVRQSLVPQPSPTRTTASRPWRSE